MATTLVVGDLAIIHYNTSTDAFSFVFLRDVEAGTTVNFTDSGWLAAGGFRPGEGTVTYTAPAAITAGTVVTLTGLDLDAAGDQIIAYQGNSASPTVLHLVDFGDGNNTVAGDATDDNTTALPPGFTFGVNAVAVAFDTSLYAGPTSGSRGGLFAALNNSANWLDDDGLPAPLIFNAKPTIDLDNDNSTHTGDDYEASVTSGGPAVPIADADIVIGDDDGTDIFAAEFRIIGVDVRDLLTINGALPPGIGAAAYRAPDGILRLEGQASHAAYAAAIRQVEFSTTDTPGDLKRIQVSVFDGQSWSQNSTAFINVTDSLVAAPPGLDLDANNSSGGGADATATYTAGGPAKSVTDSDVLITDDGTTIASATITILGWARNPGDQLSVAGPLPGGITASTYSEITGVLTLSGSASLADYQTALHQVVYSNTLASPSTADRGIQVTVNDGGQTSNLATMYMHVVVPPPNAAPVLDLDANNSTTPGANHLTGFTEGGPPVAIADADVSIFDSDGPSLASATITLTNPQTDDVLTFDGTPPTGIAVSGSGTSVVTLTGAASSASYQTALQQIKFSNGNIDPSNVTRIVEVVVNDGIINSNTATAIVQVEAVNNSAPVIDLDPNDSSFSTRTTFRTAFTENGAPIAIADTDTTITDLDSSTLVSATITLANQHPGDLLTAPLPLPGGIVASTYDPGTGVLTLTGVATLDEYEAALQLVLYSNTSDNPVTEDRLIEVVVNDGANTSNVAAAVINVVAVNDAPDLNVDTAAVYVENAAAIALSPLATLTDVDDTELNDLVVRITGGVIPGDGDTLTVGGLTSGTINGITFLWDAADHAMVLTGASLVANYQDLLRTVAYHSTSDNPTDFNAISARTLTWSVSGGTAVTTATTTLNILAVNDAPQATVAAAASYTENAAPVVLSPAATVTDVDDIDLVSGEVRIVSGAVGGDLITVNGLQSGTFSGIDFSYDAVLHSLTFTHPTDVANYQAFLEAVAFSSTSDNPTNSGLNPTRTLSWFVFDGAALSAAQTTVVTITAANDAPVNTVAGPQSVNEDTTLAIGGVSVADADGGALTTTLSVTRGTLNVTAGAGVSGNGTAAVTITGTATQINTALAGLSYRGNLNLNGPDTLTVTTGDGIAQDIDTVAITVNPVNDPPQLSPPRISRVNEDTTLLIPGMSVSDVDSLSLATVLEVTHGIINVTTGTGATVGGNGTAMITITGTVSQTNAALAGLSYRGNLNFNGEDTLVFRTSDEAFTRSTPNLIIVDPVNDPPVAQSGNGIGNEDTPISGTLVATDVDSPSLTYGLAAQAAHGVVVVNPNGSYTYTPNLDFNGADSFTFTASDGTASSNTATISLTVNPVNDPPVNTVPGAQTVNEDTVLAIGGLSVADVDGPTLTTTLTVANGLLTVVPKIGVAITGNLANAVTISGSVADVNAALAGVNYIGNPGFAGADTLTIVTSDGALTDTDTLAITVNPVNDAPVLDLDADNSSGAPGSSFVTTFTENGPAIALADIDLVLTDDGPDLTSARFFLINAQAGDSLVVNGALPAGISATITTNELTLTGTAPVADYQTALHQIAFSNSSDAPDTSDRLILVTVDDGGTSRAPGSGRSGGGAAPSTSDAFALVHVLAVNDAPVAQDGSASGNEDTPISGTLVATDIDGPSLTYGLGIQAVHGNVVVNPNGSYTYTPNQGFNGADSFTFTANDGTATSNTATISLTVNPVNDPPVAQDGSASGNEDTPIGGTLVATDVDSPSLTYGLGIQAVHGNVVVNPNGSYTYTPNLNFNGADSFTFTANDGTASSNTATISLTVNPVNDPPVNTVPVAQTVNEDTNHSITGLAVADVDAGGGILTATLSVTHGTLTVASAGGAGVSGSGTGSVMLTGTTSQINTTLAAANNVVYRGVADYNGPDSLTVTTSDGGNSGSGGALTDIDAVAITVNAVNDRPLLDLDVDNSSGAAGVDYATTFVEGGAAVAVADLDDLITDLDNPNLASATITLANHQPADLLGVIGALPAGIMASAYDPLTGVLMLSGAATLAAYQGALRQIAFSNSSSIPSATDRIINIVVNDGAANSFAAHAFVHMVPVDTAPVLDLDADDSSGVAGADYTAVFSGGGAAIPIADADTLVADVDSSNILSARIALTNAEPADFLQVNGTLPTGIAGVFDPGTGILTLSGSAPLAAYQAALQQIEFGSSDPIPFTATRVIEVVVNDGVTDSDPAFSLIQIASAAPPLTLDLDADDSTASGSDYATTFTENGGGVRIADTDLLFSSPILVSATITLTNLFPGDLLSVTGPLPAGVTAVYDSGTGVMTLIGPGSGATLRTAAEHIVYSNTTDNPATDDRIITVVVNDGVNDSNTATAIVKIVAVNDPPSLSVATAASYTENDAATLVSPVVTISDPDSSNLTIGVVAITAGLNPGDELTVGGLRAGALGPVTFNWAPSLNELIVTGAGSLNDFEALFQSVRFHSDSDDPTNAGADTTRTISWAVFDGTSTVVSTTTLTISAVNDAPVAQDGSANGTEDTTINGSLVATDVDSPSLTYSLDTQAAHGTAVVNPDGSYSYTPNLDFNGTDSFVFTANDGSATSNTATVGITVNPVNDPPVAQDGSASGNEDTPINGTLVATDVDSSTLTYALDTQAAHGNVVVNPDGSYTYTPNLDFIGADSFTFAANDGSTSSNTATVSLTIHTANAPPIIVSNGGGDAAAASVKENTTAVTTVHAIDVDSPVLTYAITGGDDASFFFIDSATGALSFITAPNFEAPADSNHDNNYVVQASASDGGLSDTQILTVTVTDVANSFSFRSFDPTVDGPADPDDGQVALGGTQLVYDHQLI